jgi:hypothetical protein
MNALNRWARDFGYNDFDTFVRAGGSILDAAKDIAQRIRSLQDALKALPMDPRYLDQRAPYLVEPDVTLDQAKAVADRGVQQIIEPPGDEPPDPENAQIQGAEHGEP